MDNTIGFSDFENKKFRIKIGLFIKEFREKKGYSQEQLAMMLDVNRSTISKIENGKFAISIDYLERLAFYLDFDIHLQQI